MALLPGGRGSELVRELSGTDSGTVTCGTSGTTEVASFAAVPGSSRTSSLLRPAGRIKSGLAYRARSGCFQRF
ncbi:hypothetical protein CXB38_25130 [Pseudomonas syringae]|nr:hypothetical protein CXB38_25130 [Pseudomonas syringae]